MKNKKLKEEIEKLHSDLFYAERSSGNLKEIYLGYAKERARRLLSEHHIDEILEIASETLSEDEYITVQNFLFSLEQEG